MSDRFHNPYQFATVSTDDTSTLKWNEDNALSRSENKFARHDFWHEQGLSGSITATLTTLSPVVIGGKQTAGDKAAGTKGNVAAYRDCHGTLAIPGNSLRGMISSYAEIVSRSAMRVLDTHDNKPYSLRMQSNEAYKSIGVLFRRNNQWFIYPVERISTDSERKPVKINFDSLGSYSGKGKIPNKADLMDELECYQAIHNPHVTSCQGYDIEGLFEEYEGIHYIRGRQEHMQEVHLEKCFKWNGQLNQDSKETKPIPDDVIQHLESTLESQFADNQKLIDKGDDDGEVAAIDFLPKGYAEHEGRWYENKEHSPRVLPGDLVYFKTNNADTEVVSLGFSAIGRRTAIGSLAESFRKAEGLNALPWGENRDELTPAEQLFGVVEDSVSLGKNARSLASRLRFADASGEKGIEHKQMEEKTLKILNSPKPPSPSMYFSSGKGEYVSKADFDLNFHRPNGRKRYLPHHPEEVTSEEEKYRFETQQAGDDFRPWMHVMCKPIKTGASFTINIHFDNLHEAELDLLIYCLQPDPEFIHRLGLGKPLGLGHVKIDAIAVSVIDRQQRYTPEALDNPLLPPQEAEILYEYDEERAYKCLVDREAAKQLLQLGSLEYIKHPVCYPYSSTKNQSAYNETKSYEWFVENDRIGNAVKHQILTKNQEGKTIETLDSE